VIQDTELGVHSTGIPEDTSGQSCPRDGALTRAVQRACKLLPPQGVYYSVNLHGEVGVAMLLQCRIHKDGISFILLQIPFDVVVDVRVY